MHLTKLAFGTEPSSHRYRLRLARYRGLSEAIAEFVRSRPDTGTPLQLLDVGVGSGRTLRYCDTMGLGSRLAFHGVDNGERRLETVFGGARWELKQADIANGLPYPDGRFDIVVCEQLFKQVADSAAITREMSRVLVPGGLLVVGVRIFRPAFALIRRRIIPSIDRVFGVRRDHVQAFSLGAITRLLTSEGNVTIRHKRGFRVISGGPLRALENSARWYRFQRRLGRMLPSWCIETQFVAIKN